MMKKSLFNYAVIQVEAAAEILQLKPQVVKRLKVPQNVIEKKLRVKLDSGKTKVFKAYRSQHSNALGPFKGGIRFHPEVSLDEVKALSVFMSLKAGLVGLPYGGGKGGVICDPKKLSLKELEALSRAYMRAFAPYFGPWQDVPAPDVNTNPQIMAWMVDEYENIQKSIRQLADKNQRFFNIGANPRAVITGKPLEIGGSQGRMEATGQGGVFILESLAKVLKWSPQKTTVAVQGFGNAGFWFAQLARKLGFKIVAISDSKGGVYLPRGIDPQKALDCKKKHGALVDCACSGKTCPLKAAKKISNQELLELPVKVLAPAALENVIHHQNAGKVKAKVIIELANGPVTPNADEILAKNKIISIPDILANSGGVIVSYFEWVQNLQGYYWEKNEVNARLKKMINKAFKEFWQNYQKLKVTPRMAAYTLAIERIAKAMKVLGR
ncbi:Glu/Leu/Phe/Val dehydrogenase [Patescibacteria group bacterium]